MPDIKRTLDQLKTGEAAVVLGYEGEEDLHYRLKELGLIRGTVVQVKRFAPLGDPMEIILRGYNLSIRKQDASKILVKPETRDLDLCLETVLSYKYRVAG